MQFNIVRVKDRLSKPATGGYRDIQLNGSVAGHVCELQLHIKNLVDFKAQAHVIYGILRSVEEKKTKILFQNENKILFIFHF